MGCLSTIELRGLVLTTDIGTYGPEDVVPDAHLLDLSLTVDASRVLIPCDGMDHVFDYDRLILEIDRLAGDGHYETQERLVTRIAEACAEYAEISGVEIRLHKSPVMRGSGALGVRLVLDADAVAGLRNAASP
jgi:dihydroneopterin aldolase